MAEVSTFRGVIEFFGEIGIYDVVLPFLLIFTIVFAILEKTRVLGSDTVGDKKYPKKNLNAIVAFVIAFLVVASSELVKVVNESMARVVLLLLVSVSFLMLVGSFYKEGEGVFLEGGWKTFFMILMFIGVLLIFFDTLGWAEKLWSYLQDHWTENFAGSIILLVIIIIFMLYITKGNKVEKSEKKEEE